jgi:hypothetical protein
MDPLSNLLRVVRLEDHAVRHSYHHLERVRGALKP